jgi:hypothetical protein
MGRVGFPHEPESNSVLCKSLDLLLLLWHHTMAILSFQLDRPFIFRISCAISYPKVDMATVMALNSFRSRRFSFLVAYNGDSFLESRSAFHIVFHLLVYPSS